MKKILIWIFSLLAIAGSMAAQSESNPMSENAVQNDSTIDVIGWFNKYDTLTYWIRQTAWQISDTDTVRTGLIATKVRINVVDSTANGYKMDYTFLEFPTDTIASSPLADFQNKITAKLGQKIVGTTIHFETDEYGKITKYNNLGQIKKQAKSLFKQAINDFSKLPEIQGLKEMGLDIKDYAKQVDTDKLVDGYLEELKMLFMNHGLSMQIGENTEHEDATDTQFENTTYSSAYRDNEDGAYHIIYDVTSILPQNELKAMVGGIVEYMSNDSITEKFNENFDSQVKVDGTIEDYLRIDYMPCGWPYYVVRQKSTMIGNRGKLKQTVISLDSYTLAQ